MLFTLSALHQLVVFLKSEASQKSAYIDSPNIQLHVKRSIRFITNPVINSGVLRVTSLDIGSVYVPEKKRNQGIFSNFLVAASYANNNNIMLMKSVANANLAEFLIRNNWKRYRCQGSSSINNFDALENLYLPKTEPCTSTKVFSISQEFKNANN